MARSKGPYEMVWVAGRSVTLRNGDPVERYASWLHPERVYIHELSTRIMDLSRRDGVVRPKQQMVTTHVAIRPLGHVSIWVVSLAGTFPLREDQQDASVLGGIRLCACWIANDDALRAALAFVPVHEWDPAVFQERVLPQTPDKVHTDWRLDR